MAAYEKACQEFKDNVLSLLEQQSALRPVSQIEKELLLANIQHRFQGDIAFSNLFVCKQELRRFVGSQAGAKDFHL